MSDENMVKSLALKTPFRRLTWISVFVVICGCRADQAVRPISTLDLRKYGYRFVDRWPIADYTEMAFLSENLLVVSVNQRTWDKSAMLADADSPKSEVFVLDLKANGVKRSAEMPIRKSAGSLHAVIGERFAVLTLDGFQLCDRNLECGPTIHAPPPLFVSPRGKRIAVGGNGMTRRKVFDIETLREVASFEDSDFTESGGGVIPGDSALLVSRGATSFAIRQPGKEDRLVEFSRGGKFTESRFLDDERIIFLDHSSGTAVVYDLDGRQLHSYQLERVYRTTFLPTAAGQRFGIYEYNLPGIEETGPDHFQRVRVVDSASGNEVAKFQWDPQSDPLRYAVTPQLSPSGHLLARVRKGVLEVLQIKPRVPGPVTGTAPTPTTAKARRCR